MSSPFFLIGAERSGSTLFRLMLDHHPEIACNLESDFLVSQVSDDGAAPEVAEYARFLRQDRVFRHSRFLVDESLDYQALVESFLSQKRDRDGKRIVGATVHHHFHRLPLLWPDAKLVYLLRDGRDVAHSAVGMGWAGNAYCGADIWIEAERRWSRMRSRLDPAAYIEVRFEDLVERPAETLSRVCGFLGVDYSEEMLGYPERTTYSAPNARLAFQWRSHMSARTREQVEARIGHLLLKRGYPLSGQTPRAVGKLEDLLLRGQSKIGCFRSRIDRYGWPLTLEEFTARKLGLRSRVAAAQARFDAIIDQSLR